MDVTKYGRIVVLCYVYFIHDQHKNVILVLFRFPLLEARNWIVKASVILDWNSFSSLNI